MQHSAARASLMLDQQHLISVLDNSTSLVRRRSCLEGVSFGDQTGFTKGVALLVRDSSPLAGGSVLSLVDFMRTCEDETSGTGQPLSPELRRGRKRWPFFTLEILSAVLA